MATAADCPAASVPVQVRVGAYASLERVPQGWTLTRGNPNQPDQGLTYASPAEQAKAQQMGRYTTYTAPSVSLSVTFPALGLRPTATVPPLAKGNAPPSMRGTTTSTAVINGFPAKVTITYSGPAGQAPSPAFPQGESISWSPTSGTTLNVEGTNIPPAEMLDIARSATYRSGTVEQLPPNPSSSVTPAAAERALPPSVRPAGHAALSSWTEIEHVGRLHESGPIDYRPAWLVYAPAGTGKATWAIVDAKTGRTLRPAATSAAAWVYAVTDRAKPGCQPPLGVLTRSEYSELRYGGAPPTGAQLILTSGPDAASLMGGFSSPCTMACDPLVWISYDPGTQTNVTVSDPFTGQVMSMMTDSKPLPNPLPQDLAPGPAPALPPASSLPPPAPFGGPAAPPGSASSSTTSTTTPIVGPSPFYPGTQEARPAPAGNGKGPGGSCNGTETYPPCGPGAVEHEYYPYTLPSNCNGIVYFDGRYWQLGLYQPNQPLENVWMSFSGNSGGWVGPGAVGMTPAPAGAPPACGTTPASVPPLAPSG